MSRIKFTNAFPVLERGEKGPQTALLLDDAVFSVVDGADGNITVTTQPQAPSGALVVNPSNPSAYQTIQAAIDAGVAAGGNVNVAIASNPSGYDEDLVIPPTAKVTIRGLDGESYSNYIDGTITWAPGTGGFLCLDNVYVSGAVGGAATVAGRRFVTRRCFFDAAVAFTGETVIVESDGGDAQPSAYQGYFTGLSSTGRLVLGDTSIGGAVTSTTAADPIFLDRCRVNHAGPFTTASTEVRVANCVFGAASPEIAFSGSAGVVTMDQQSLDSFLAQGGTVTNGIVRLRTILPAGLTLTIATGVVTATHSRHAIAGEGAAADDLVTINGTVAGQMLVLSPSADDVTITVKNGTGNIFLAGSDFAMDNLKDRLLLISDGTNLYELGRGNNGA